MGNMMMFKDMFYKGYSEEELVKCREVLAEELSKLEEYREVERGVEIGNWAWVGTGFR